jgi:hypothetical protein
VQVFNSSALPIAYKAEMIPTVRGGAWLAWHVSVSSSFYQARVQRLDAAGAKVFAHNGVEISLEANRSDFNPSIVPLRERGDVVFYNKHDSAQAQWASADSNRPPEHSRGETTASNSSRSTRRSRRFRVRWRPRTAPCVSWSRASPGSRRAPIVSSGYESTPRRYPLWTPTVLTVAATPSGKDEIRGCNPPGDEAVLRVERRTHRHQRRLCSERAANGGLAPRGRSPPTVRTPSIPQACVTLVGGAPFDRRWFRPFSVIDPTASFAPGASTFLALAALPTAGFPCGIPIPNTGMIPGTPGELLVDLNLLLVPLIAGSPYGTTPSTFGLSIPALSWLVGIDVFSQAAVIDASGRVGLTQGGVIHIGP